jgi:hypothetical protein
VESRPEGSGVPARDTIGHPPPMMHPSAQTADTASAGVAGRPYAASVTRRRLDGAIAHVNVSFAPLRNGEQVDGVLGVLSTTDRVRATRACAGK